MKLQGGNMRTVLIGLLSSALTLGVASAQSSGSVPDGANQQASSPTQRQNQASPNAAPSATSQPSPTAPTAQAGKVTRVAPGSVIPVALVKTIDAKKAKTGDEVVAKVTQDLKTNGGEVILAKDTKVVGHVTEAQARSKEQKESQLAVLFDRAVTKDSGDINMPMSIQAIIGSQNNNPQGGEASGNEGTERSTASMPSPGRSGMSGASASATPSSTTAETPSSEPSQANHGSSAPITAQTRGVIGISDLTLAPPDASKGSVFTSEKNNVKIESGTMLLLRVNQ
jgi:hypothetical protein